MHTARLITAILLMFFAMAACTTTGSGAGQLSGPGDPSQPVAFSWTSTNGGISGTMTAMLPGQVFQGRFFQITQQTRDEVLTPLWLQWDRGWNDWPYWSRPFLPPYPATRFITHYSGKVVATLEAQDKQHMRCRFHLSEPARGMSGGGEGECQLNAGRLVRAVFSGQ